MKKTLLIIPLIILLAGCTNSTTQQPTQSTTKEPTQKEAPASTKTIQEPSSGGNSALWDTKELKPVIYLYPTIEQKINVKFGDPEILTITYPPYSNGWDVIASPTGKIINLADGQEYSYLFWEGENNDQQYDLTTGFIVEGKNVSSFLQSTLKKLGLNSKEYNEFIVYWLPQMINNKYNLIHFATQEEYDNRVPLSITPQPDSMLRIFMVFKNLNEEIQVTPQNIKSFNREGFSVIEWGGTEVK